MNKKVVQYFILFLSFAYHQEHFTLNIDETGESTLFIFQDNITTLTIGDEIGIFDYNGIIDNQGNLGEILVGSGIWDGSQLEIVGIHSVDLSQFGGPILPGAIVGNSFTIKIWNALEQFEYSPSYDIVSGAENFNSLFIVVNNISCPDGYDIDECGICGGPGAIYECGCINIEEGFCDCNGNTEDCLGVCGGNAYIDQCNVCDDNPSNDCQLDCTGTWGGDAIIDSCGVCDGPGAIYECGCINIEEGFCDCNGNTEDCSGECGGSYLIDYCGICNGDNSICEDSQAVLSFNDLGGDVLINVSYNNAISPICIEDVTLSNFFGESIQTSVGDCVNLSNESGNLSIYFKSIESIAGFQFSITGLNIIEVSGGASELAGFMLSSSSSLILGFSLTGSNISPSGPFYGCIDQSACNYDSNANTDDNSCFYPEFECVDGTFVCNELDCNDNGGDGDGGGDDSDGCGDNEIEDCIGGCSSLTLLGDGYCDNSFNCLDSAYDMGDCTIDFNLHVLPIINANCTGYCHTGNSSYDGGLNLETYTTLMWGGNSGPTVIPYYPDQSLIIQKLNGSAEGSQMPPQSSPLPDNYINTIYYWILQGALEPEDGDGAGGEDDCSDGLILDCDNLCVDENLLGNGNCDDGELGEANFNCSQFIFDDTDCPIGNLNFGDITYNNGSGTIELIMNCEFPISNYEINVSGITISGLNGGASESSNFSTSYTSSSIFGDVDSLFIPANSGLLTILDYNNISENQICFESSNITTSAGINYEAVLGDCIEVTSELDADILPSTILIDKVFPNPFNPNTTIHYSINKPSNVTINIVNLNGKKIETLISKFHSINNYTLDWIPQNIPSGIYFIQLISDNLIISEKVILAK